MRRSCMQASPCAELAWLMCQSIGSLKEVAWTLLAGHRIETRANVALTMSRYSTVESGPVSSAREAKYTSGGVLSIVSLLLNPGAQWLDV